jgi:hypothetical protein
MVEWLGQGPDYIDVPPLPGPTDIPTPSNGGLPPTSPWPVEEPPKKKEKKISIWPFAAVGVVGFLVGNFIGRVL